MQIRCASSNQLVDDPSAARNTISVYQYAVLTERMVLLAANSRTTVNTKRMRCRNLPYQWVRFWITIFGWYVLMIWICFYYDTDFSVPNQHHIYFNIHEFILYWSTINVVDIDKAGGRRIRHAALFAGEMSNMAREHLTSRLCMRLLRAKQNDCYCHRSLFPLWDRISERKGESDHSTSNSFNSVRITNSNLQHRITKSTDIQFVLSFQPFWCT